MIIELLKKNNQQYGPHIILIQSLAIICMKFCRFLLILSEKYSFLQSTPSYLINCTITELALMQNNLSLKDRSTSALHYKNISNKRQYLSI